MFVSLGLRFLCNVEALNMVESIGNVSKHRKAPIVVPTDSGFRLLYVPSISGETIGHGYQQAIVDEALTLYGAAAPVDDWSRRGEFIKFADMKHMPDNIKQLIEDAKASKKEEKLPDKKHEIETAVIRSSIIADIGGFLIAEGVPVKRTSCFQVGYAVPVFDALEATAIESQFHVRHVPSESKGEEKEKKQTETTASQDQNQEKKSTQKEERAGQMIYYVELASAVYGVTFNLNVDGIGRTSMIKVEEVTQDRMQRVKVALAALSRVFTGGSFGAKRSRYLPVEDVLTAVVSVSKVRPFTVSPPHYASFAEDTLRRRDAMLKMLQKFNVSDEIVIYGYSKERALPDGIEKANSFEEVLSKVADKVLSAKP
ncbi:MAG: type I-A CRISPR-associated protein Cas7/Csa2 [Candidatus Caldarchaeum sp.]|uniref:Type I-A CRISPR-associated protein Cas7/Csa2 n=1 Tax=Caldiarchaeum subterraneum TaxID=311458 RepID=A0A7C5U5I7_CALS0